MVRRTVAVETLVLAMVSLAGCDAIWGADFSDAQLRAGGGGSGGDGGTLETGGGGAGASCEAGFPDSTPVCVSGTGEAVDCGEAPACAGHWIDAGPSDRFVLSQGDILDRSTGILWRQEVLVDSGGTLPPCPPGYELPTRIELLSIVDYGRASPAVDDGVFFGQAGVFVTSTNTASGPWLIDFADGRVFRSPGADTLHARCKKGHWQPRFELDDADPDVVEERTSGLAFRREPTFAIGPFDADEKCALLPAAACGRWRTPSLKEMLLVISDAGGAEPVFESFDGAGFPRLLTSSPTFPLDGTFWAVHLRVGDTMHVSQAGTSGGDFAAYCVSGGMRH